MNEDLIRRIEALEEKLRQRESQQITYPLDQESLDVLKKYFMRIDDQIIYFGGAGGNPFLALLGTQDGTPFEVTHSFVRYVVDVTSNVVTVVDKKQIDKFLDDQEVILYTTDTAPGGLTDGGLTTYHVVNAASDGYSFKLAATQGGAAINITSTGTGKQFIVKI